jgi:hypothetical protein
MESKRLGGIILEGGDQSGKSFVAQALCDRLGFTYHHFKAPEGTPDFRLEYIRPILESDQPYIFDRSYVSEMAYGAVHRGGGGITPEIKEYIEDFLNARHYILVYMEREPERDWVEREEMYAKDDNAKVIAEYERIYPTIGIPKMRANSYDPDVIDKIVELYKKENPEYDGV